MNGDTICLSSDDEYEPAPKKIKAVVKPANKRNSDEAVNKTNGTHKTESVICLDSDEDYDSQDVLIINKENTEVNTLETSKKDEVNTLETSEKDEVPTGKPSDNKELENVNINNETIEPSKDDESDDLNRIEVISCNSSLTNLSITSSKDEDGASDVSDNESSDTEYFEEEVLQSNNEENGESSRSEEQTEPSVYEEKDLMADTEDLPKDAISFLSTCIKVLKKGSAEPIFKKFPVIIKMFRSLSEEFARTEYLGKFLRKHTKISKQSVSCCIISFREVYLHLKDSLDSQSIELPKKHWKHVRKLEKMMELLLAKLKELEEEEIDFDDENEEDSAYIKHEKYSKRLAQVHKKYCEIMKKNPYAGRITHERLDFVHSNYNEINHAISKKYKNNKKFPSYDELASYIQTVVEEKKLPLSGKELQSECERCFKKLGDLLQIRRKKELYEVHQKYMVNDDPAKNNEELEKRLRINFKEGRVRIEQICEEYVKKQELGLMEEEVDLSQSENSDESESADLG